MTGEEINTPNAGRTIAKLEDGTNRLADITKVRNALAHYIQEGDIVVNTFMKSGTTWMTQLILQMINNGEETLFAPDNTVHHAAPWIENMLRVQPKDKIMLEKLKAARAPHDQRRIIKSHMQPEEALFFFGPKVKYVCVFRDGRDVVLSLYNHKKSLTQEYLKWATHKGPIGVTHPLLPVCMTRVHMTTSETGATTNVLDIEAKKVDATTTGGIGTSTSILDIELESFDVATGETDTSSEVLDIERKVRNSKVLATNKDVKCDVVLNCYNHINKYMTKECLQQAAYKGPKVVHHLRPLSRIKVDDTTIGEGGASTTILDTETMTLDGITSENDASTTNILDIETKVMDFMNVTKRGDAKFVNDFDTLYKTWLRGSNPPFWDSDYFHHLKSWFDYANTCDNNILLVNYSEMQFDLANVVLRLAKFLDIHVDEKTSASFLNILHHSSFDYMKQHEELFDPPLAIMKPGSFIHKGVSGRWRNVLTESQHQKYWDKVTQMWSAELIDFVHN